MHIQVVVVVLVGSINDYQKESQFRALNAKKDDMTVNTYTHTYIHTRFALNAKKDDMTVNTYIHTYIHDSPSMQTRTT